MEQYKAYVANIPQLHVSQTSYIKPLHPYNLSEFQEYPHHVKINWEVQEISGTVQLEGLYNLFYYRGKYYFLDIISSQSDPGNLNTYKLVNDIWTNYVQKNDSLFLQGTLKKTSNTAHFSENYNITTPSVSDTDRTLFFPVIPDNAPQEKKIEILKAENFFKDPKQYKKLLLNESDRYWTRNEGSGQEIDQTMPNFKMFMNFDIYASWKIQLLLKLQQWLATKKLNIFDLNSTTYSNLFKVLGEKYPANNKKYYVITDKDYTSTRQFANTSNSSKSITNIDLSELTDIKLVDDKTLQYKLGRGEEIKLLSTDPGILKTKISKFAITRNTEEKTVRYGAEKVEKQLGLQKSFTYEEEPQIIIGYKDDEPIYWPHNENVHTGFSVYLDLDHYKILLEEDFSNPTESSIEEFALGDKTLLDESYLNQFIGRLKNPKSTDLSDDYPLFFFQFIKIPLDENWTINGKTELTILKGTPIIQYEKAVNRDLADSAPTIPEKDFAKINYTTQYGWNDYPTTDKETWKTKNRVKNVFDGEKTFTKKEMIEIVKNLALESFTDPFIARFIDGVFLSMPIEAKPQLEECSQMGFRYSIENLSPLDLQNTDELNPEQDTGIWWQTAAKDEEDAIHNGNEFPFLAPPNQIKIWNHRYGPGCSVNNEKWIRAWFLDWNTKTQDSDVYFRHELGHYRLYRYVSDFPVNFGYRLTIDIFKIYKNKPYVFSLLLRPNENYRDRTPVTNVENRFAFREWQYKWSGAVYSYASFSYKHPDTTTSHLLWPLYVIQKQKDLMRTNDPVYGHGHSELNSRNWNRWGPYYKTPSNYDIPLYERISNVSLEFPDYRSFKNKGEKIKIDDSNWWQVLSKGLNRGDLIGIDDKVETIQDDNLFDLVGTNFYLYVKNYDTDEPYFELIVKNNDTTINNIVSEDSYKMAQATRPLTDPIEIVNSSLTLCAWGENIPLKWRGPIIGQFRPEEFLIIPLEHEGVNPIEDVFLLICRTQCDYIRQIIKVVKPDTEIKEQMSISDRQNTKYRIQQEMALNRNQLDSFNLSRRKFFAGLENQAEDIRYAEHNRYWNWAQGITGTAVSAVAGITTWNPLAIAGAAMSIGSTAAQSIGYAQQQRQQRRDYEFNKSFGTKEFELRGDATKINFNLQDLQKKVELYNLQTNAILSNAGGNTSLFKSIREHLKTADVYLQVTYPSDHLYTIMQDYYKLYGYDLTKPNFIFRRDQLKEGTILKFENIQILQGIEHPVARTAVEQLFLEGFRVENI